MSALFLNLARAGATRALPGAVTATRAGTAVGRTTSVGSALNTAGNVLTAGYLASEAYNYVMGPEDTNTSRLRAMAYQAGTGLPDGDNWDSGQTFNHFRMMLDEVSEEDYGLIKDAALLAILFTMYPCYLEMQRVLMNARRDPNMRKLARAKGCSPEDAAMSLGFQFCAERNINLKAAWESICTSDDAISTWVENATKGTWDDSAIPTDGDAVEFLQSLWAEAARIAPQAAGLMLQYAYAHWIENNSKVKICMPAGWRPESVPTKDQIKAKLAKLVLTDISNPFGKKFDSKPMMNWVEFNLGA